MVAVSFINPLSDEGKQIATELGSLDNIFEGNSQLITAVERHSRDISKDEDIPKSYADLAIKRIEWSITNDNEKYFYLFYEDISRFDVISFYLLCQSIAIKFGPNSRESRLFVKSQGEIIQRRLGLPLKGKKRLIEDILQTIGKLSWTDIIDLISSKEVSLNEDLILNEGIIVSDRDKFMNAFKSKIIDRNPEGMYQCLIKEKIKEIIINKKIMQETRDYIKKVNEMSRNIEPHPSLVKIGDRISEIFSKQTMHYESGFVGDVKAAPLNPKAFPPCVKMVLEGMKSGGRNDAIILFLTPFISYARLYPDVFRKNVTVKVSDLDPHLSAVQNEILPLIHGAAECCTPPLFDDQPQEKVNINAKLGFGMHATLELEHEGESTWYTPMGCEKVKLHLPSLCKPDSTCKKIGNPLTYYNKRMWKVKEDKTENKKD